ncbi:zinc ribbon domain-containing protein [Butyrivibrio sp. FCS014]|uniref:zinc ribbon domain-containing protein n=1 Tax=Butyrivibrio sp. FCS014 TaxID=1408304 RepID=UPI0004641C67|nr:zinc ribbon domain-containing protein [Butyrivibrio sp. FCS014]
MFCNNCGAQITPDQKFCNNCGVALNPPINPQPQMPSGANPSNVQGPQQPVMPGVQQPVQMQPKAPAGAPQQGVPGMPLPQKKSIWPLMLILIAALLLVSVISVFGFRWMFNKLTARFGDSGSSFTASERIAEDLLPDTDDIEGIDDLNDFFNENGLGDAAEALEGIEGIEDLEEFYNDMLPSDYEYEEYEYANMVKSDGFTVFEPNGEVDGTTQLRPGKDLDGLCDFIDSEVLEDGRKIDRNLLYDLISVNIVDSSIIDDDSQLENNLMLCLTIANEFSSENIRIESCMYEDENPDIYYYNIIKEDGDTDTWLVNISEGTIGMDYGMTEYKSAGQYGMFSSDALAIWITVIDMYYEIG